MTSGFLQRFSTIVANQLVISHNRAHLIRQALEASTTTLPAGRVILAALLPLPIVAAIVPPSKDVDEEVTVSI